MNRVILLAVVLLLSVVFAAAAEPDYVNMTDEELQDMVNRASAELEQRTTAAGPENTVIFDALGTTITVTGVEVKKTWNYNTGLILHTTIVSASDYSIEGIIINSAVNGWEVDHTGIIEISAGHKEKADFSFDLEGAEIETLEQVETLELSFSYTIAGRYVYTDTKPVTIYF